MSKALHIIILLFVAGTISSCSFHRRVAGKKVKTYDSTQMDSIRTSMHYQHMILPQPDTTGTVMVDDGQGKMNQLIADLKPLWTKRLTYTTFSGKAKVHYEGPDQDQEFTAHFRIRKDSIIWIAITGLGGMVPVAKLYITPDSIIMVNQLQKEVTRLPLSSATKLLPAPVDFTSIQNLIVGEPLREGTITDATNAGGAWSLQVDDSSYIQRITYNKTDSTMRSGQLRTRDPKGPQAMIQYGNYEVSGGRKISTNRVIHLQSGTQMHMLDMDFQRNDFDVQQDYPVNVPGNYKAKEFKSK